MKIDLIPMKSFITVNRLPEVTNPIIFDGKSTVPTEDGLLSTTIFGINSNQRRSKYAYIDLKTPLFHPVIYKSLLRMFRNVEYIVNGTKKFIIDKDGYLVEDDDNGQTGIDFLYNNWAKIKFKKTGSKVRQKRIDLMDAFDRDTVFVKYWIVIPAFYRDVNLQDSSEGKIAVHEITKAYSQLIRYASIVERANTFDFMINMTKSNMQQQLVELYNNFRSKLDKKNGLLKKSLLGKSVDFGARTVISAPLMHFDTVDDMLTTATHSGLPLYQCCSLMGPFILYQVKRFFRMYFEASGSKIPIVTKGGETKYYNMKDPELFFNEDYILKNVNKFVKSPYNRFDPIKVPVHEKDEPVSLRLNMRKFIKGKEINEMPLIDRSLTWTDVLYLAAYEVAKDKYVYITRYPLTDITSGIFSTKISVLSTLEMCEVVYRGEIFKHYPVIDPTMDKNLIPTVFRDTLTMSNVYLAALGGDKFVVSLISNNKKTTS